MTRESRSQEHHQAWREAGFHLRHREALRGLGLRWRDAQQYFARVPEEKALAAARGLYAGHPVLLLGGHGTGKTTLATYLAWADGQRHAHADTPWSCRYWTLRQLFQEIRDDWTRKTNATRDAAKATHLLVLDEVDAALAHDKGWGRDELAALLDHRYGQGLPLILIGNAHPKRFASLLGSAAADRLRQNVNYIPHTWESYRVA